MNENNLTDFIEYKQQDMPDNNVEELSDEMLQAYFENIDMETPDLWNRIEAGFEAEVDQMRQEQTVIQQPMYQQQAVQIEPMRQPATRQKPRRIKWNRYVAVAAAILVFAIAIPVIMQNRSNMKSDNAVLDTDNYEDEASESMEGEAYDYSDTAKAEDAVNDFAEAEEDVAESKNFTEDAEADYAADENDAMAAESALNGTASGEYELIIQGKIEWNGEFYRIVSIDSIIEDNCGSYSITDNDSIIIQNTDIVLEQLNNIGFTEEDISEEVLTIYLSDVSVDDDGNYTANLGNLEQ